MSDMNELCKKFQENYVKKHGDAFRGYHNIYICQTVDRDGNVTDTKYGMNHLTNFAFWWFFGWDTDYEVEDSNDDDKYPYTTSRYRSLIGYIYGGNSSDYYMAKIYFNTSDGDIGWTSSTFTLDDTWSKMGYNGYWTDRYWNEFHNGIISTTLKAFTGYYDYELKQAGGDIGRDYTLTGIKIILPASYFKMWDSKYQFDQEIVSALLYDFEGNVSSIVKKPHEKLIVTVYITASMRSDIYDNLYANNVMGGFFLPGLLSNMITSAPYNFANKFCARFFDTYHQLDVSSLSNKNDGSSITPTNNNEMPIYKNLIKKSNNKYEMTQEHGNFLRNLLITEQSDSALIYVIKDGSNFPNAEYGILSGTLFTYNITLPNDGTETLSNNRIFTRNPMSNELYYRTFGWKEKSYYNNTGMFNINDFTVTSVKSYNYRTHDWDIDIPFTQSNEINHYNHFHNGLSYMYNVYYDGRTITANVFFNLNKLTVKKLILMKDYISFYNMLHYAEFYKSGDNSSYQPIVINELYASDAYWDPSSWELIINPNNIDSELGSKRYFILVNPSLSISAGKDIYSNGYTLVQVYDEEPVRIGPSNIIINSLPTDEGDVAIASDSLIYGATPKGSSLTNATKPSKDTKVFNTVGYSETEHPWMMCGNAVIYFNSDITQIVKYYELPPDDIFTFVPQSTRKTYTMLGRYQYKNRVALQQHEALYQYAVYDFSDYTNEPTSWLAGITGTYVTTSNIYSCVFSFQSDRYVISFEVNTTVSDTDFGTCTEFVHILDMGDEDEGSVPRDCKLEGIHQMYPILNTGYAVFTKTTLDHGFTVVDIKELMDAYDTAVQMNLELPPEEQVNPTEYALSVEGVIIKHFTLNQETTASTPIAGICGFNNNIYINIYTGDNGFNIWHYDYENDVATLLSDAEDYLKYALRLYVYYQNQNNDYRSFVYSEIRNQYFYKYAKDPNDEKNSVFVLSSYNYGRSSVYGTSSTEKSNLIFIKPENPMDFNIISPYLYQIPNSSSTVGMQQMIPNIKYDSDGQLLLYPSTAAYNYNYNSEYNSTCLVILDLGMYLDTSPYSTDDNDHSYHRAFGQYTSPCRSDSCSDDYLLLPASNWNYNNGAPSNKSQYSKANTYSSWFVLKDRVVGLRMYPQYDIIILPVTNFTPFQLTGTTHSITAYNNPKNITMPTLTMKITNA